MGSSSAGTLDVPTTYSLTTTQKTSIVNWLNSATEAQLKKAYLSSSVTAKVLATRPYSSWNAMWTTSSVGANTTVQYALIELGIYGPLNKTATTWDLAESDRSAVVEWINTATKAALTTAGVSSSTAAKILVMRPYRDFAHLWSVPSVGSNTNVKNALIAIDLYTNPYDYKSTRAPLRVRVGDRTKMITWVKNVTDAAMTRVGISSGGRAKLLALKAAPTTITWKKLLSTLSDGDLQKIGIDAGAIRYVSGSKAVERISGVGTVYGEKFRAQKLFTVQGFLMATVWPEWRAELAGKTGIAEALIVRFAKRADLDRVTNVGEQYGDLLAWAGIETIPDLAAADPVQLRNKMIEMNAQYNLVNTMPSQTSVTAWVNKARTLPKILEL